MEIPYKHHVITDASHRCECLNVILLATFHTTSRENRQPIQSVHRTSWCAPVNWHKRPLFTMCA